jgi:hypothetical protein
VNGRIFLRDLSRSFPEAHKINEKSRCHACPSVRLHISSHNHGTNNCDIMSLQLKLSIEYKPITVATLSKA